MASYSLFTITFPDEPEQVVVEPGLSSPERTEVCSDVITTNTLSEEQIATVTPGDDGSPSPGDEQYSSPSVITNISSSPASTDALPSNSTSKNKDTGHRDTVQPLPSSINAESSRPTPDLEGLERLTANPNSQSSAALKDLSSEPTESLAGKSSADSSPDDAEEDEDDYASAYSKKVVGM